MPFDAYIQDADNAAFAAFSSSVHSAATSTMATPPHSSSEDSSGLAGIGFDPPPGAFSTGGLQFQIPQFMYSGAPTLAPGGGAEVLPVGMLHDPTWFNNHSGFSAKFFGAGDGHFPKIIHPTQNEHQQIAQQQQRITGAPPFDFDAYDSPLDVVDTRQQQIAQQRQMQQQQQRQQITAAPDLSLFMAQSNMLAAHHRPLTPQDILNTAAATGLAAPSPLGLPVYSASGFDLLSILARVATRPHPRVVLGPVDLTCSFVVVDVRRHDQPIVYCSPSFCRLTGYEENEILGRNCRFLQAPGGLVHKGDMRTLTSYEAVVHLKKSLTADKECQTSIVNYRKDGTAFINLVTVIPILGGVGGGVGEEAEVVYHVGFQVDLTEQPNAILEKLRDGSYLVDYSNQGVVSGFGSMTGIVQHGGVLMQGLGMGGAAVSGGQQRERKTNAIPQPKMAKELRKMLANSRFLRSIPITTSTTVPTPLSSASTSTTSGASSAEEGPIANGGNQPLHLLLLEASPDFVHVVSLKGSFLYVAPSVRRVLGYEPQEMVGKSIADFTHPEDVVPLMRELKESSATGMGATGGEGGQAVGGPMQAAPRTVDLLFRARTREGAYVWVECCGRLHVEPGKGRKAIVLSGRAKEMPKMSWEAVRMAGGLVGSVKVPSGEESQGEVEVEREFWGTMSGEGMGRGVLTFLSVGAGVRDVLGWTPQELVGRGVAGIVLDAGLEEEVARIARSNDPRKVHCRMRRKDGGITEVVFVLYRPIHDPLVRQSTKVMESISPAPLIYQVKLTDASSMPTSSHHTTIPVQLTNSPTANIFEELEISRGSSWQYELEKLKFTNQRLMDEIAALEAQTDASPAATAAPLPQQPIQALSPLYIPSPTPPVRSQSSMMENRRTVSAMGPPPSISVLPTSSPSAMSMPQDWMQPPASFVQQQQRMYHPHAVRGAAPILKRSWNAMEGRP